MGFYVFFPPSGGGSSTNDSIGLNGAVAPTSSTQVAGQDPSGNLSPLQTDANGYLITTNDPASVQHVIVDSSALPTDASTSALQTAGNASLTSIDSKLTSPLAVTGPLTDTQLRATPVPISGTVTTSGTATVTGTVTANAGTNLNTSALNLESTQAAMSAKLPATLGQKASAASMAVVLASDQSSIPVAATLSAETTKVIGTVNISANQSVNTVEQYQSGSTGALSSAATTALAASLVIKASAGRLYQLTGINSAASSQYIQLFNSTTLPADGATPLVVLLVPANANFSFDLLSIGKYFSTGIVVSNSSTLATKTIGTSTCWFNAEYL